MRIPAPGSRRRRIACSFLVHRVAVAAARRRERKRHQTIEARFVSTHYSVVLRSN
jgi:hypothetical protein